MAPHIAVVLVFCLLVNSVQFCTSRPLQSTDPSARARVSALFKSWPDNLLNGYLSNEQLSAWSQDFTTRCSKISRRFSIGKSVKGVDLWVVEIAANPGAVEAKPNFKYVANMHGDEPGGRVLLPMLAEWMCSKQSSDARASRIINDMHLFLMPTMNPDGFARRTRYNAVGADLNRDFPSPFLTCKGQQPESCDPAKLSLKSNRNVQPETAAIMAWSSNDSFPFTAAANLHEGAVVTNYPWDGYLDGSQDTTGVEHQTSDYKTFQHLAKAYSLLHPTMGKNPMFENGITNGAAWYPVYGSMQDWDYTAAGCMDVTLELSDEKFPAVSTLSSQWSDNLNSLLSLPLVSVLGGVSGTVTDTAGKPLKSATVTVDGILMKSAARGPLAYYNKPLAPGTYTIRATAPGYKSAEGLVTVGVNGQGVKQDFQLVRSRQAGSSSNIPGAGSLIIAEKGE